MARVNPLGDGGAGKVHALLERSRGAAHGRDIARMARSYTTCTTNPPSISFTPHSGIRAADTHPADMPDCRS